MQPIFKNDKIVESFKIEGGLHEKFLSRKAILAQILKYSVEEYSNCELEEIEKKYIEGDPTLPINTVPLDDTLDIKGRNAKSKSPTEGLVTQQLEENFFYPGMYGRAKLS